MKKTLAILGLGLLGCASSNFTVYAEKPLVDQTIAAVAAWDRGLERACPWVSLYYSGTRDADIVIRPGKADGYAGTESSQTITIDLSQVSDAALPAVISHEIGHALGAKHSTDPADIMYPMAKKGRGVEPTGYDIAQVCAVW